MQTSFSALEYGAKKKVTRRDRFLSEIEAITPWVALVAELEAHYPRGGGRGRPPIGLERMLRMYVAPQCFGLSDEGIEDAIYDSQAIRRFVGIDLAWEAAPDATTLLKFRRRLERGGLTRRIFEAINAHLAAQGLMLREGTIVDATIIAAAPSTKNRERKRDPQMHQTKKGKQYYFGMKAHIGADAASGLVHSLVATAANAADIIQAHHLLHGSEVHAFGDSAYQGVGKHAGRTTRWFIAMKRSARTAKRRRSRRVNGSRPESVPGWSIPSTCSRTASGIARRATGGWRRMKRSSMRCSALPICCSPEDRWRSPRGRYVLIPENPPRKGSENTKSRRTTAKTRLRAAKRRHSGACRPAVEAWFPIDQRLLKESLIKTPRFAGQRADENGRSDRILISDLFVKRRSGFGP